MCGIVGYTGNRGAQPVLVETLRKLEYRGYDSAGIAVIGNLTKVTKVQLCKNKGTIDELVSILPDFKGTLGIAHTRWATCGQPIKNNAHPFLDCKKEIALVHNGIIENHLPLRTMLTREGHVFTSETDTEVVVHLIERYYKGSLENALREALKHIKGSFAIVAVHKNEREKIVVARKENPLVIGLGKEENFVASDVPALLPYTNRVIYLHDGEVGVITRNEVKLLSMETGKEIRREHSTVSWSIEDAEKGGYEHFMLKEIYEQPTAIHNTLLGRLEEFNLDGALEYDFEHVKVIGCGTSYHAALVGKYIFESLVKVPTTVEIASEYRYASPYRASVLLVALSQSGETADTIAAAREARKRGAKTIGITNVVSSSLTREVDSVIYTRAGPEIGVAATKTFNTQLVTLYLLAMKIGVARKTLDQSDVSRLQIALRTLPRYSQMVLDRAPNIHEVARKFYKASDMFFVGRHINYPVALEGALKAKEISYIHAEGYPAGELKHGPLALLTEDTPVVAIAVKDHTYEKVISNVNEMRARGAPVIGLGYQNDHDLQNNVDHIIHIPEIPPLFSPVPATIALQLLAYHFAKERGCPIDKPRNLAKSVTVE